MKTALLVAAVLWTAAAFSYAYQSVPDCPTGADPLLLAAWAPSEGLPRATWICVRRIP